MQEKPSLDSTLEMMRDLRKRCDWDRAQTHDSLRPYLLEEMHELDDAIRSGRPDQIRDELGDVLLQVLFHSVIAEERGEFDASEVAAALMGKMRRRHPHLYGGGERESWEAMKARTRRSIADGLPAALPALHRAHRLQERAAGVGFDWDDTDGPARKVEEELAEARQLLTQHRQELTSEGGDVIPSDDEVHRALEAELGDLIFACVNLCRRAGVHAGIALDRANEKFARRFKDVERLAAERNLQLGNVSLAVLDSLWDEAKAREAGFGNGDSGRD